MQYRNTRQRKIVLEAVQEHHDHPSADQIYLEIRAKDPRISRGTVYRNLNIHRSIAIALLFAEILFVMTSQPAHSWEVLFPWLGLFMRYVYNSNLEKKTYGYCISLR